MRRTAWILSIFAVVLTAGVGVAEEVVFFSNGTSMVVASHELKDGMIHVDLGDDAKIAFPEYMVEKIEGAGQNVQLASGAPQKTSGRMVAPKKALGAGPSKTAKQNYGKADPRTDVRGAKVEIDDKGVAVYRPYANSRHPGKRKLGAAGSQKVTSLQNAEDRAKNRGAVRRGVNSVINGRRPSRKGDGQSAVVPLELKPRASDEDQDSNDD